MNELALVTILAGVLAVGVALAALIFALLNRLEGHVDDRFNQLERRLDEFAERVSKVEVEQARLGGRLDASSASGFGQAPASTPE